jgi:L-iditol 2-dehydrogenase
MRSSSTMRAAVLHGQRDVRVEDVPRPEAGPGEVLLRNEAALTCGTDAKVFRRGYHARMLVPPTIFGHEVSGIVERVGEGVTGIEPGARVVVANSAPCGCCASCRAGRESLCEDLLFWNGAYAEYSLIPARIVAKNLLRLPDHVSFAHGALVEPLACVVRGVDAAGIREGQTVGVIGVGPIGLMFVALSRLAGARVIAVGRNAGRLARAATLGADSTIALLEGEDIAERLRAETSGRGPEVVVEAAGTLDTADAALRSVARGGVVNFFAGCPVGTVIGVDVARIHYEEITLTASFHHTPSAVRRALDLVAAGKIDPSVLITRTTTLDLLPSVLAAYADGGDGLKALVLPHVHHV